MSTKIKSSEEIKESVKKKYGEISNQVRSENAASGCGATGCCDTVDYAIFAEDYSAQTGYNSEADLGLGCGLPTEYAKLKPGDTVVDLGSGAGNDCFVARQIVGDGGRVIGIDMTEEMNAKARRNAEKLNYSNVEFKLGDIEDIPLKENIADVVVSNCVMNLVPDKMKAFSETYRIIKPGGHFSISDVVTVGELPDQIKEDAELYAGCVAGAIDQTEYLSIIKNAGFKNVTVQKSKKITVPDEILLKTLTEDELKDFRKSGTGIYSITVFGEK
ncbi:MAG: arsenite methyltransferase [Balneolaceae bacterium]